MAAPADLLDALNEVDIETTVVKILKSNEGIMEDLMTEQLSKGFRSDGTPILPDYAPLTVELKSGRPGLAGVTDRVTLYDTGNHYSELFARIEGQTYEIGSTVEYSAKLEKKYSTRKGSIYGLNEDSRDELAESHLRPEWEESIEKQTGLKFKV